MPHRHAIAAILAAGLSAPALATDVTPSVVNLSASSPKLDAAGTAYEPFDARQAVPSGSKGGIRVQYLSNDFAAFPLNAAGASVKLRPSAAGATITCAPTAVAPVLTATNGGQCFYSLTGAVADTIQIFYLGLLTKNEQIRYTISGLTASAPDDMVLPFDSDTAAAARPTPTTGRNPARLVMVIDKSGSMDWSARPAGDPGCGSFTSPAPACRRWNILTSAATQMANVAKAYATPGDQLGVVFFDSMASNIGGGSLSAMNTTTLNAAVGAIAGHAPGGGTSIGAGVENLKAPLIASAAANTNMTLLFTDGEQNVAPFLVSDGAQLLINPTQNQPFGAPWVGAAPVGLCAFRLRTDDPAGPGGTTTLQQIADRGCGGLMNSSVTLDAQPADLISFFLQVLQSALVGDKIETIAQDGGALTLDANGSGDPVKATFRASEADGALTVLLNWASPAEARGGVAVDEVTIEKDGVAFRVPQDGNVVLSRGQDHLVMTLRAPFCNADRRCAKPAGDWTLSFRPRGRAGASFSHSLFVLADNASIASRFAVRQPTAGVGEPLVLTADLREAGKPIAGLRRGSVYALVSGPTAGLGNVMSQSKTKPQQGRERDPLSLAGQKSLAMFANPAERQAMLRATGFDPAGKIALEETAPGTYTAKMPAKFEGVFRVTFMVDGKAPQNGPFQRTYSTDRYVPVVADPAKTLATLTIAPSGTPCRTRRCYDVGVRPIDAAGNLYGPGKGALFTLDRRAGTILGVDDRLDGSYLVKIMVRQPTGSLPPLLIGGPDGVAIPLRPGRGPIVQPR